MCDVVTVQQIGSYAINNLKPKVRRETKKTKEIIHPCFIEYSQYVDDPEWQQVFTEAAYGKFPRGFSGRILSRQGKRAGSRKNLYELGTRSAALACMSFFRVRGNHSSRDRISNMERHRQYMLDTMQKPTLYWNKLNSTTQFVLISRCLNSESSTRLMEKLTQN